MLSHKEGLASKEIRVPIEKSDAISRQANQLNNLFPDDRM